MYLLFFLCAWPSVMGIENLIEYTHEEQHKWEKHCSIGKRQSPIHIDSELAIPLPFPALEMVGFHNLVPSPVFITNNGHSVEIKSLEKGYAQVFGAFLPGTFEVEGIHFHWGSKNNKGSEHVLNQIRFPMEMHMVTRNQKYSNLSQAMEHPDGLAVLAMFYQIQEQPSRVLRQILKELAMIRTVGSTTYLTGSLPLSQLVPKSTDIFYSYQGSLTTPPCSESVIWIVFPDPLPISYSQMTLFRHLSAGEENLVDNFRQVQRLGSRKVYVRRQPTEYSHHMAVHWNLTSHILWGLD
ncbi:unnamed protein product [Nezara viridula]|uniref:Carbonic anhydrase n=1 Tax=Nezara viridula TaxID=85310 RepID=A0A9P0MU31_NEZVI|nr:unnamed protein product [Nezara viridula]